MLIYIGYWTLNIYYYYYFFGESQVNTPRLPLREVVYRRGQQPISWLQETVPGGGGEKYNVISQPLCELLVVVFYVHWVSTC